MILYVVENTVPETGEVRFVGRDRAYISADTPHKLLTGFARSYGFRSEFAAEHAAGQLNGDNTVVVRVDA